MGTQEIEGGGDTCQGIFNEKEGLKKLKQHLLKGEIWGPQQSGWRRRDFDAFKG